MYWVFLKNIAKTITALSSSQGEPWYGSRGVHSESGRETTKYQVHLLPLIVSLWHKGADDRWFLWMESNWPESIIPVVYTVRFCIFQTWPAKEASESRSWSGLVYLIQQTAGCLRLVIISSVLLVVNSKCLVFPPLSTYLVLKQELIFLNTAVFLQSQFH